MKLMVKICAAILVVGLVLGVVGHMAGGQLYAYMDDELMPLRWQSWHDDDGWHFGFMDSQYKRWDRWSSNVADHVEAVVEDTMDDVTSHVPFFGGWSFHHDAPNVAHHLPDIGDIGDAELDTHALEFDLAYGNYKIITGSAYTIAGDAADEIECWFEDGCYYIRADSKKLKNKEITIAIPDGTYYDEIKMDVGAAAVKVSKLACDELDMDLGVGSLNIGLLDAQKIDINCGVGDGGFTLAGSREDYTIDAECAMGTLNIDKKPFLTGIAGTSSTGHGAREVDIECGVGVIDLYFEHG